MTIQERKQSNVELPLRLRVARLWKKFLTYDRSLALIATIIAISGGLWGAGITIYNALRDDPATASETQPPIVSPPSQSVVKIGPDSVRDSRLTINDVYPPGGIYDASYFQPTFGTVGFGSWGFWMPTLAVATFPNMRVHYSFDGVRFQSADMSSRFFVNEDLSGKSLFLKIEVGQITYGPFRYDFDFAASAVTQLVKNAMAGWPFNRGTILQPENKDGFPILAAFDLPSSAEKSIVILAAVSMPTSQYLVDFGDGFYQTFNSGSNRNLKLRLDRTVPWPADGRISIKVKSEKGEIIGPSIIDIDAEKLARIHWASDFDETMSLKCQRALFGAETKVICSPGDQSTIAWAGLSAVEVGLKPDNLTRRFDIKMTEEDLLTIEKSDYGPYSDYSVWSKKTGTCLGIAGTGCDFNAEFPTDTEFVYVRFFYSDGRISDIHRVIVS